ncbi:hypothetical protein UlMin_031054 [Ulmus minor]
MRNTKATIHVLLVSFPGQGHVNPLLRLGKHLASKGLLITMSTTQNMGKDMRKANDQITDQPKPIGDGFLRFEFFEDGWEENDPRRSNLDLYFPQLEHCGKKFLPQLIKKQADPVSCLINNPFIPWVCDVANDLGLPCATLWVQSCACFAAYYHYLHKTVSFPSETEPELDVQLPSMPLLKHDEVPSFLHPRSPYKIIAKAILAQFSNISKSFCVLVDTFYELEQEIIDEISKLCLVKSVGPLFKLPKEVNQSSNIRSVDLMKADNCIEWLDQQLPESVVYISFGTVVYLKQEQIDEIAHGLLSSGVSFLWVIKPPREETGFKTHVLPDGLLEKVGERGKVVKWSPQEQVLEHRSVACFLTHCGWNSSVESLTSGVPVVTFPQWGDQVTNAKFLVDVFGVGLRLGRGADENRLIGRDEVEKCLVEATVGEKAEELRKNALKWKKAAAEAVVEGGSSDRNIQEFVEEIRTRSKLSITV